jgi:hypothetical protein
MIHNLSERNKKMVVWDINGKALGMKIYLSNL